ncbi:hypothetical protein DSC47_19200 [Elizabethkingia miricola]|nr:hypothetical protein VO54_03183 [Elizabethkingia miricola]OPC27160.1 hypothetical protein BAY00_16560 [Elizabethkingia bruuniana]ATL43965.1 hypothetical protein CQS02_11995 [Elizabethkingia miricola]OPC56270.1 hypothetical protein BAY07_08930 [Elizabethkingia bruuniana]OPC58089.1 hypothetical protein BAY13_13810 [Elizabethkingia bruuniana]
MQGFLKKYWYIVFIVLSALNFLGYYLIKVSIGIFDALEHVDSDEETRKLKSEDFLYTILIDLILIIDFALILYFVYRGIRYLVKLILKKETSNN